MSTITAMLKRYRHLDYSLVVRVVNGHLIVTSPDFEFPVPIVLPYDPPSIETGGKALVAAWLQIANYLKELADRKEPHPAPRRAKSSLPRLADEVSMGEACRILGMKPDMVRILAREGKIPFSRTPKGHRRFSRKLLQGYIENHRKQNTYNTPQV
jgi:excisionase family DNA binding protein